MIKSKSLLRNAIISENSPSNNFNDVYFNFNKRLTYFKYDKLLIFLEEVGGEWYKGCTHQRWMRDYKRDSEAYDYIGITDEGYIDLLPVDYFLYEDGAPPCLIQDEALEKILKTFIISKAAYRQGLYLSATLSED